MNLFVKFSDNYADEFDIYGFTIMSEESWIDFQNRNREIFENYGDREWYFGTNEYVNYDTYDDFIANFSTKEISTAEEDIIEKFILEGEYDSIYGVFPDFRGYDEEYDEE